jgi:hypothetical protein
MKNDQKADFLLQDDQDEVDSTFGRKGSSSYSGSLSSSVPNFTYENGCRYRTDKSGEYLFLFPNDPKEPEMEYLTYHIFQLLLGGDLLLGAGDEFCRSASHVGWASEGYHESELALIHRLSVCIWKEAIARLK